MSRTIQHYLLIGLRPGQQVVRLWASLFLAAGLVACDRKTAVTESRRTPEVSPASTPQISAPAAVATVAEATPQPATPAPTAVPEAVRPMAPIYTGTADQWRARMTAATPAAKVELLAEALATGEDEASWIFPAAMADASPQVRLAAAAELNRLSAAQYLQFAPVALKDAAPEIRQAAIDQLAGRPAETLAPVLAAAMSSEFPEVRDAALEQLTLQPNATLLEVLFAGLDDPDEAFQTKVREQVQHLVRKEFASYEDAATWWKANRASYNNELVYVAD